jgi:hypothetical protein
MLHKSSARQAAGHALFGRVSRYFGYAIGENVRPSHFVREVLIVVGILITVQISNWNQVRLERIEERDILRRISEDIATDLADFPRRLGVVKSKDEALNRLALIFKGEPIEDNLAFLSNIRQISSFGWGQPPILTQTFKKLVSSGKLGIVRDIALRNRTKTYCDSARGYLSPLPRFSPESPDRISAQMALVRIRRAYRARAADSKINVTRFAGGHEWHAPSANRFLDQALKHLTT